MQAGPSNYIRESSHQTITIITTHPPTHPPLITTTTKTTITAIKTIEENVRRRRQIRQPTDQPITKDTKKNIAPAATAAAVTRHEFCRGPFKRNKTAAGIVTLETHHARHLPLAAVISHHRPVLPAVDSSQCETKSRPH